MPQSHGPSSSQTCCRAGAHESQAQGLANTAVVYASWRPVRGWDQIAEHCRMSEKPYTKMLHPARQDLLPHGTVSDACHIFAHSDDVLIGCRWAAALQIIFVTLAQAVSVYCQTAPAAPVTPSAPASSIPSQAFLDQYAAHISCVLQPSSGFAALV